MVGYVALEVMECDFTNRQYDTPVKGAGALNRGATGRWCVVMHAGPEYLAKHNIVPLIHEEAVAECEGYGGHCDF